MLTVSLTPAATFAGVLATVSTVSVTGAVAEVEPPPEDPPDEDEPPEVPPDEEPEDPEALELPPAPLEPPELELDGVLGVEFDPLDEEDDEDSVVGAGGRFAHRPRSVPGASSTTGAARVTSSAFAV